jgi:hypothetical protein
MIAVVVSLFLGLYLLIPSIIFDRTVAFFVPAKKFARSRIDEIFYGLIIAGIPAGLVLLLSHLCFYFGHHPFSFPAQDYSLKWDDYRRTALALVSDSFFKENSAKVWSSADHIKCYQARFLTWMYLFLALEIVTWTMLLANYGRLQKFRLYRFFSSLMIGRVSEWHVLLTNFVFHPAEKRIVFVDVVTPDGLYKGRVRSYFTDKDGNLSGVLLDDAARFRKKELEEERLLFRYAAFPGEPPQTNKFWTKIKGGTHLYVPAGQISNLNVRYELSGEIKETDLLGNEAETAIRKILSAKGEIQLGRIRVTLTGQMRR